MVYLGNTSKLLIQAYELEQEGARRLRVNWHKHRVEIISGSALSALGLGLTVCSVGALAYVVSALALAVLLHGCFRHFDGAMRLDYEPAIPALPPEITQHIFSFLAPHEMGPVRCVCREYRHLGSEEILGGIPALKKFYPNLNVIDPEVWNKYADCQALGIDPTGAPQPTTRALGEAIGSFYNQVEDDVGATVFTLPKGLTWNKLMTIARQYWVPGYDVWDRILRPFGDEAVIATRIQVISNSVLKNSRNKSFVEQQTLCSYLRCEVPDILTATALVVLSYLESSDQPADRSFGVLSTQEDTYTHSPQRINGRNLAVGVIGGFAPRGLHVYDGYYYCKDIGVMALRKF